MKNFVELNNLVSNYNWSEIYSNPELGREIGIHILDLIANDEGTVITHNGVYHSDDLIATALLQYACGNELRVIRTRDSSILNSHFTYDVGGMAFDHHAIDDCRIECDPSTCLSSLGKLWLTVGRVLGLSQSSWKMIDEQFIKPIDITDNTGKMNPVNFLINAGRPAWNSQDSVDDRFHEEVNNWELSLKRMVESYLLIDLADTVILKSAKESTDGVVRLHSFVPSNNVELLISNGIHFITWPKGHGQWMIKSTDSSRWRIPAEVGKMDGVTFVHKTGFICQVDEDNKEKVISYILSLNS
jgi:uncharacterized UPF0160 family protein